MEEVGTNVFLTDQRVRETVLSDYDTVNYGNELSGVVSTESLVGSIRRFQEQINNHSLGQTFDASNIPVESISLANLANDTLGTEDPRRP